MRRTHQMQLRPRAAASVTPVAHQQHVPSKCHQKQKQIVSLKQELKIVKEQAAAAGANAEVVRREKSIVETSLRDVQEDLVIQQETTMQMAITLDTWHNHFDRVYQLAEAAGVDPAMLRSIRYGMQG